MCVAQLRRANAVISHLVPLFYVILEFTKMVTIPPRRKQHSSILASTTAKNFDGP